MKTLLSIVVGVSLLVITNVSFAEVPHLINYQGKFTDSGGIPLNGAHNISFRIYDAAVGGNLKWSESHTGAVVDKGIVSILLGSITPLDLPFNQPYWLAIQVGGDPEMTPRQRLASVGYAYRSESAVKADNGVPVGGIITWSGAIANIPNGWALCDGTNGTPDLRDKFIVGAGTSYSVNATGGEASHTLTIVEMPSHTHTTTNSNSDANSGKPATGGDAPEGSGYHTSNPTGGGQPHENRPPYYALAYIMKTN